MNSNQHKKLNKREISTLLNKLVLENKIKFNFYNNDSTELEILQVCYNKKLDIIELQFRDVIGDRIKELKEFLNKSKIKPEINL